MNMKPYAVITDKRTSPSDLVSRGLYIEPTVVKYFDTIDEAVYFANKLDVEATIYKSIAKVKIKHEIEMLNENNNNTTSVENKVS